MMRPIPSALFSMTAAVLAACAVPAAAQPAAPLPPDSQYVVVKNGQLTLNNQRVRYWAAIGRTYIGADVRPEDTPAARAEKVRLARRGTDYLLERYEDIGFNALRQWDGFYEEADYTPGDGSAADSVDYFIFKLAEKGFKIWSAGLNQVGDATPEDVTVVNDPSTADAWKAAIAEFPNQRAYLRNNVARIWDPRLEALGIARMERVAKHYNRYRKMRWSDDPTFVVWELSNEEWWMARMLGGQWQQQPAFFRNSLIARWNAFLKKKYGNEEKLKAAWNGLLPGETLDKGSILLAPMAGTVNAATSLNDGSPVAQSALKALKQQYTREDFAPRRASDVLEFFLGLHLAHKEKEAKAVKSWGKSCKLSPLVRDTGIGYEIHSQYLHQESDAVAHDAYTNGIGPEYQEPDVSRARNERERLYAYLDKERISANVGYWVNWLLKPPGLHQGVPWLEHNRVEGKPFLAYETQIQQLAKYRADYPLRVAALAGIQDWDFVCWHYFQPRDNPALTERPFDQAMDVTRAGGHPQGYHFTYDEVQNAMMRAASHIFRNGMLKPAPRPTKFIYGRKSLFDPESMTYAGSYGLTGLDMIYTVYQYGVRIQIDPKRETDQVIGPVVKFTDRHTHNPYTPTDQILFDWKKGYLSFDAPEAVAWTGLLANYGDTVQFKNSPVTLRNVTISNPEGIFSPVTPDEKYIAFALHTLDGQPLQKSRKASLSLVSTSFNSGTEVTPGQGTTNTGKGPVLVVRVGGTVQSPALVGMRYTFRDWHMKPLQNGVIGAEGALQIPADQPVWVVELER